MQPHSIETINEGIPARKQGRFSPILVLFFGILVVSTSSILIRSAQKEVSSLVIAAYRLTFAALLLLPLVLRGHRSELTHLNRRQILLALLSGVFLALHFATWITSLQYTTVASSVVLVSTSPLWVALFSPLVLRERPSRLVVMGMAVTLLGTALVGLGNICQWGNAGLACVYAPPSLQGGAGLGNGLALFGAFAAAGYLLVGRWLRPTVTLIVYIFMVYGAAAVVLILMVIVTRQPVAGYSFQAYLLLLGLAVGPQLLGHTSFNYGLRYLSASYVSVALLGEPVGTTILALLVLKEIPTTIEVVGGMILFIGIFLASRGQTG